MADLTKEEIEALLPKDKGPWKRDATHPCGNYFASLAEESFEYLLYALRTCNTFDYSQIMEVARERLIEFENKIKRLQDTALDALRRADEAEALTKETVECAQDSERHAAKQYRRAVAAEARIAELTAALESFARADRAIGDEPGPFRFETRNGYREISRDDLRRARAALRQQQAGETDNG